MEHRRRLASRAAPRGQTLADFPVRPEETVGGVAQGKSAPLRAGNTRCWRSWSSRGAGRRCSRGVPRRGRNHRLAAGSGAPRSSIASDPLSSSRSLTGSRWYSVRWFPRAARCPSPAPCPRSRRHPRSAPSRPDHAPARFGPPPPAPHARAVAAPGAAGIRRAISVRSSAYSICHPGARHRRSLATCRVRVKRRV